MTIEAVEDLDHDSRAAALALQAAAREADGAEPFSEQVTLRWQAGNEPLDGEWHLLARDGTGSVAGYGYRDPTGTAEFAVHPPVRRQGYGRALLAVLEEVAQSSLQIWSHGDQPGAQALAARTGYRVVRGLIQMRRTFGAALPPVQLPDGVTLRSFVPGTDDAAWLRLNAAAFAHHPEQGRMTQADLSARMREDWFDPEGFLIAEQDGVIIGFHWTKVHPASDDPAGEVMGEVYVVGVDPAHHGGGLGTALTLAGLHHLRVRGLRTVLLYVEADNEPALAVYRKLEFEPWRTDVMYRSTDG